MVLSSSAILTNNHVIRGATTIKVVVPKTGHSYTAKVVGYNWTSDVAVLQASGASNLKTVTLGTSAGLTVGQWSGGRERARRWVTRQGDGSDHGLSRTITVNDDTGGTATLRNLIETSAKLQPGDSGGPLSTPQGR